MIKDRITLTTSCYSRDFWDGLKNNRTGSNIMEGCYDPSLGGYALPGKAETAFFAELRNRSFLRRYATVFTLLDFKGSVQAVDAEDPADFYDELESYPIEEIRNLFHQYNLKYHKISALCRIPVDFTSDTGISLEEYLPKHIARRFAKAEENAFLNGGSPKRPIGILEDEGGAELGITSASESAITYDEILSLYFSVDSEYRSESIWVMNDRTALQLRKLKDEDGNYLWDRDKDSILGKKVIISNYMPDMEPGKKCIAFGDFSYYWILDLSHLCIKKLSELFVIQEMAGFLAKMFLEGRLVRPEAVKVLKMKPAE